MEKKWKIETAAVQGGYDPGNSEPRVLPIYQSTTYKYDTCQEVAKLFDLEAAGHMYTRISNPTVEALEKKMAMLEGGIGAMATSSGQAATMISIMTICTAGDHLLAASTLYGGSFSLLKTTFKKFGIEVTFVNPELSLEELKTYIKSNTKVVFAETIGNPGLNILDFDKFSTLAHDNDIPLIVDNTFPTPYLCRPIEYGADIVVHSCTKYTDGHATSVGGMIIDSGKFNWDNGKFPEMTTPDESYHGVVYVRDFKEAAYITKARVQLLRDIGATMSPFNAFLMNLGLETLPLRMERHSQNALAVAKWLEENDKIEWVVYPGLDSHPTHYLAKKYLPDGSSGVLTFGVKGGREAGEKFIDNLNLIALVVHVADTRSCVLHPASTTHRQLSEEEQIASGVKPDLVRFSVGLENIDDIIDDLANALEQI
ncbi:O-acetylhomoserine aminocarboxypropyltransferase/cysteine synthase family protein [Vallitalea sp.]|jgi:O-acetylhomoserine (thiol)-lyase|uniref:O-acetylhomoserine aminocarboxypropyltransferase/cysteine synthase family protein n=1 Tax=Vallitalea sp. TaxID=1882829 RepID=UPI0025FB9474|nr:O-acetylhomoserine aminocarboxypropyltransferase/cysteine synthase family protein [Vallitalea sp.]MCT4687668.1 O-acetylhomoserine aminocarboxypropyltransferase/cysteine synthase [Vallitalea sp.]